MWYQSSVFYQIYPFGFCGAPGQNIGEATNRILRTDPSFGLENARRIVDLRNRVAHGYDTRDYQKLDTRLGSNEDFAAVCAALHQAGIRVVLDGVFNHVGRGFWAFRDVLEKREASPYKDWFYIDFGGDSNYGDGFWYDGWEGHYELVKLNLSCPAVADYLLQCVAGWVREFDIDGIRLDVAYCLQPEFIHRLRAHVDSLKPEFYLMGEMLHGDYKALVQPGMLDSATNYECYKGIYSSLNSHNLFEIAYSLNRQFGAESWTLYKGLPLFDFVDNHDVSRIASALADENHLACAYGLLFGMPGVPCLYYGSEWGAKGEKKDGDAALRPAFDAPVENELCTLAAKMAAAYAESPALQYGAYRQVYLTNNHLIFERKTEGQRVLVVINAENAPHVAHFNAEAGMAVDMINGDKVDFGGGYEMPPYAAQFLEMER